MIAQQYVKPPLFTDDKIVIIENSKRTYEVLEIRELSKMAEYKVNK